MVKANKKKKTKQNKQTNTRNKSRNSVGLHNHSFINREYGLVKQIVNILPSELIWNFTSAS